MDPIRTSEAETSASNAPPARAPAARDHPLPAEQRDEDIANKEPTSLEKLAVHNDLNIIQRGVTIGNNLLDQLETAMNVKDVPDAKEWLRSIDNLRNREVSATAVIAVMGVPGSGKTSLIAAILNQKELVPTDVNPSMAIGYSYNHLEDPSEMYQAEVQFLEKEEFIDDLRSLSLDLTSEEEAESAYAKLKVLYPNKTKETMIAEGHSKLADSLPARKSLGRVVYLKTSSAKSLRKRLRPYIDTNHSINPTDEGGLIYAPLVKNIEIYIKAEALSTGVTLVDIPNGQQSNSAQVAEVEDCIKSSTGVWVVAPASRVIKPGRGNLLLRETFKRQLVYDGKQSSVTLIISRTDETHFKKVLPSINTGEWLLDLESKLHDLGNSEKKAKSLLADLRKKQRAVKGKLNPSSNRETIDLEPSSQEKRLHSKSPSRTRKNLKINDSSKENSHLNKKHQLPAHENTEEKFQSLENREKVTHKAQAIDTKIDDVKKEIQQIETRHRQISEQMGTRGIHELKDHLRKVITQQFESEIEEFNKKNISEYIANSKVLARPKVFCTSSTVHGKLRKESSDDGLRSRGYLSTEDTEIPILRDYTKRITEDERVTNYQGYFNELTKLLNSLKLWTLSSENENHPGDSQTRHDELHLRKHLADLSKGLGNSVRTTQKRLETSFNDNLYDPLERATVSGRFRALGIAQKWGLPKAQGGLAWSTYRATCRGNGYFDGTTGAHDFNQDLFKPMSYRLMQHWDDMFQDHAPDILEAFFTLTKRHLDQFENALKSQFQRREDMAKLNTLLRQLSAHKRSLKSQYMTWRRRVDQVQRDVNRIFIRTIRQDMMPVYQTCAVEKDDGCLTRMRDAMNIHVASVKKTMYNQAADKVRNEIQDLCDDIVGDLRSRVYAIHKSTSNDCLKTLVVTAGNYKTLPAEVITLRSNVNNLLHQCESLFATAFAESRQTSDSDSAIDDPETVDTGNGETKD
ncbi:hypothetical protein F4805DRAFT_458581 [Annulohypoxylon moriforme]|nr:hypothetical protein F4805DRAFT_458581 [Annulohypoxylon moriforme]